MRFRTLLAAVAAATLTTPASGRDYDYQFLSSAKSEITCAMESSLKPLFELRNSYAHGILAHNASNSTSMYDLLVENLFVKIKSYEMYMVYVGFEDWLWVGLFQNNSFDVPPVDPDNANTTLSPYVAVSGGKTDQACLSDNITEHCIRYYYTNEDGDPVPTHFRTKYYQVKLRPWYASCAANGTMFSATYADYTTGDLLVSPSFQLHDQRGRFVGVAASDVGLADLEQILSSGYPYYSDEDAIIFMYEYGDDMNMVSANIAGVSIDSTGTQIRAPNCSVSIIATEASELKANGFPMDSIYVSTSGNFVQATMAYKYSGVPLSTPWVFVEVQPIRCDSGYRLKESERSCEKCPKPTYSPGGAHTNCSSCVAEYYMDLKGECKGCPANTICDNAGSTLASLVLEEGYWRAAPHLTDIRECRTRRKASREACTGGNASTSWQHGNVKDNAVYCTQKHWGPYCALCAEGYYVMSMSDSCHLCPQKFEELPQQTIYLFAMVMALILISIAVGMYYLRAEESNMSFEQIRDTFQILGEMQDKTGTKIKITATTIQITAGFFRRITIDWPKVVEGFALAVAFIDLDISKLIPMECIWFTHGDKSIYRYQYILVLNTIGPLVASLFILLVRTVLEARSEKQKQKVLIRDQSMFAFLFFTFLIYPVSSSAIFNYFAFDEFYDDDGKLTECYLSVDYSFCCGGSCDMKYNGMSVYTWWLIYASAFIFVYPLGIPLMYFVLLWRQKDLIDPIVPELGHKGRMDGVHSEQVDLAVALRKKYAQIRPTSFLYSQYEPIYWWWEVLECFRRLLLTSTQVFLAKWEPAMHLVVTLCLSLFSLKSYSYCSPFISQTDDEIAELSQWIIVTSLISMMYMDLSGAPESVGYVFVMINLLLALWAGAIAFQDIEEERELLNKIAMKTAKVKRPSWLSRANSKMIQTLSPRSTASRPRKDSFRGSTFMEGAFSLTEYLAEREQAALDALHLRRPHYKDARNGSGSDPGLARTASGRRRSWGGWGQGDHDESIRRDSEISDIAEGDHTQGSDHETGLATANELEEHEFVPVLSLPPVDGADAVI